MEEEYKQREEDDPIAKSEFKVLEIRKLKYSEPQMDLLV